MTFSKYDPRKDAIEPKREERREREQGGCGDPNCPMCYNLDGSLTRQAREQRYQFIDINSNGDDMATLSSSMRDEYERVIRQTGMSPSSFSPAYREPEAAPNPLKAKLAEAREPIKQYILSNAQATEWSDVIGNERAATELREAIEASTTQRELYEFYEMTPPKGVLLWGPPGCGKTMFGKAAATAVAKLFGKESELILVNGAEIESPILSVAGKKIAALFEYARLYKQLHGVPVVLFIDEADALLRSRARFPISTEVVSQFLAEMDGLKDCGAFVILATNQPDDIDEALLRDGRCERKIKITRPDRKTAEAILNKSLATEAAWNKAGAYFTPSVIERLFDNDYLIQELTNPESGAKHRFLLSHIVSGAMLVGLLSRAKALAFRRDIAAGQRHGVTEQDLLAAVDLIYEENKGLSHLFAMKEFVTDVALPAETLKSYN